MMPEKITPDTRAKIVKLRKEGKSFVQIEDELKVKRGALSHIGNRSWFVAAMKEKEQDGKTGYQLYKKARLTNLKEARKARPTAQKEKEKEEEKEGTGKGSATQTSSKGEIDKEIQTHIKGSDKDPRRVKQKKEGEPPGKGDDKVKKEKGKKGKGTLLIILILIVVAVLIIAVFMIFGRKEKAKEPGEEAKKEEDGRPFDNL